MQVTQSYATPSHATSSTEGMQFNFSPELSRPPVRLDALIKNSLSYARIMLALRQVVIGDWRGKQKDHTAYQAWVTEQYLKELPDHLKNMDAEKAKMLQEREKLTTLKKQIQKDIYPIQSAFTKARYKYYDWLYRNDRDKWMLLDPVIIVHQEAVIIEDYSQAESAYGRVSVASEQLETFGDVDYGTTNIDFSMALANELYRVRSYRPAWLKVAFEQVALSTDIGASVEKKIDLPESWVRGFLQVQSASSLEGIDLTLHSQTLSQVLSILEQRKEKVSPRSLRFQLATGQPVKIVIDPWEITIEDTLTYTGDFEGEIRLWGRRRLSVLKELLPYTDEVHVKLLGTGMPSYWSIFLEGHRFDIGLSGWTANDWAKKGNFDLLASTEKTDEKTVEKVEKILIERLALTPKEVATTLQLSTAKATTALQTLCQNGQAMYDHLSGQYRWRQLLKQDITLTDTEEDERLGYALTLLKEKKVTIISQSFSEEEQLTTYHAEVQGKNLFKPVIQLDTDGKVKRATCTCGFFRSNKLRKGPCMHLMATIMKIGQSSSLSS